jgi:hypothetical protein
LDFGSWLSGAIALFDGNIRQGGFIWHDKIGGVAVGDSIVKRQIC